MEVVRFEHPEYFWLLLSWPVFLVIFILFMVNRSRRLKRYADSGVLNQLSSTIPKHKHYVKFVFLSLALVFGIIGAANLQFGSKIEEVERKGIDIMLALDLSRSMDANDVTPSRLAKAKLFASNFIDQLGGDRIGLVVFAGNAFMQSPLTTDYAAAKMFLSTLDTKIMPTQGTAIGEAIKMSLEAFQEDAEQGRAIIVVSDGEDHDGEAMKAAEEAKELGVLVQTIGVGTVKGKPVPVVNRYGRRDFQRDKEGNIITSKLNEIMLSKVASAASGNYFRLDNSSLTATEVLKELDGMKKAEMETRVFTDYEDRFQYFFLIALFFLLLDMLTTERRNQWLKARKIFE